MKRRIIFVIIIAVVAGAIYFALTRKPREIILTGIVATDQVIVGSEIQGRVEKMLVKQGDTVKQGDLLALIQPKEWQADLAFYANSVEQSASQVTQAEADLRLQEAQTSNQIAQAEANLGSSKAQSAQASADLENAQLTFKRVEDLFRKGVEAAQTFDQARTAYQGAKAHLESLQDQARSAESALAIAVANGEQIAVRRAMLEASVHQLAAVRAQKDKAKVRLDYSEIRAPVDGIVDVRGALPGEVVNTSQGIVTLINPDDLWVRIDVEETYIEQIRLGDKMKVRLPSGAEREGTVFFRGVDADFATQRDVSRTKRDIKTFEVRLRCDNSDRRLAVGMTAQVPLPLTQ